MGGGSPLTVPDSHVPYAITCSMLVFVLILWFYETILGILAFILGKWSELQEVVIGRMKEELLELGVVSLLLGFIAPVLSKFCVPAPKSLSEEELKDGAKYCGKYFIPVFPATVINASHFILFWIAMVQIIITIVSALVMMFKYRTFFHWEQLARSNVALNHESTQLIPNRGDDSNTSTGREDVMPTQRSRSETFRNLFRSVSFGSASKIDGTGTKSSRRNIFQSIMHHTPVALLHGMDIHTYLAMRGFLRLRVKCDHAGLELRMPNLAAASEQLVHHEMTHIHAHAWVAITVLALIALYQDSAKQLYWISPVAFVLLLIVVIKQYRILVGAAQLIDEFAEEMQHSKPKKLQAIGTMIRAPRRQGTWTIITDASIHGPRGSDAHNKKQSGRGSGNEVDRHSRPAPYDESSSHHTPRGKKAGRGEFGASLVDNQHGDGTRSQQGGNAAHQGAAGNTECHVVIKPAAVGYQKQGVEMQKVQGVTGHSAAQHIQHDLHHDEELVSRVHGLQHDILDLFWFQWPELLLWMVEIISICNACVTTYSLFALFSPDSVDMYGVSVVFLVWNLLACTYAGLVALPQYAVLSTAIVADPEEILHHLKWSKVANKEGEHGVAGVVQRSLIRFEEFIWHRKTSSSHFNKTNTLAHVSHNHHQHTLHGQPSGPHQGAHGAAAAAAEKRVLDAWMAAVAARVGVVLPGSQAEAAQDCLFEYGNVFGQFVNVWRLKASVARGEMMMPIQGFEIQDRQLSTLFNAYQLVNKNSDGVLEPREIQDHLKEAYNVRVSRLELKAIMYEVAGTVLPGQGAGSADVHLPTQQLQPLRNTKGVSMKSFVAFAAFAFLDEHHRGYITAANLEALDIPSTEADDMINLAAPGNYKVGSINFINLMADIRLKDR